METFREFLIANFIKIDDNNRISVGNNADLLHKLTNEYIRREKLIGRKSEIRFVLMNEFTLINTKNYPVKYGVTQDLVADRMFWSAVDNDKYPYGTLQKMVESDPKEYQRKAFEILGISENTKLDKHDVKWVNEVVTQTFTYLAMVDFVNKKVSEDLPDAKLLDWHMVINTYYLQSRITTLRRITNQE